MYRMRLLQPAIKALGLASKVQLAVNDQGTLKLQLWIKVDDSLSAWADYIIPASLPEDDADDGMA